MSQPKPRAASQDRRAAMRFDKVIPVSISSADYGEVAAVARNISAGGMQIETPSPLPLGSEVRIHFRMPDSQAALVARAEVKNHYALNYYDDGERRWARGMGVRFLEFVEDGADLLRSTLTGLRTLH